MRTVVPKAMGGRPGSISMTTLVVPHRCDGGPDRVALALGLKQSGSEWIGDCPACEGSEALAIRASREDHPEHCVCVCQGACVEPTALRNALSQALGPDSPALPESNNESNNGIAAEHVNFGGALPRKRD